MRLVKIIIIVCSLSTFTAQAQTANLLPGEKDTIDVFKKSGPYVVNVHRVRKVIDSFWRARKITIGTGSGILWNTQGYVVTNYHVVGRAKELAVTLKTGKTIRAKLMGGDPRKDVAVLKLEDIKPLKSLLNGHALVLADIATLEVGQTAIAIGNPFGLSQTLTEGVVSAMNREIPGFGGVSITGMIQTDASINPGNSGGPLLDSQGQLLGMNTMIYSRSGSFSGIGFAIPTNTIKRIVDQMIQYGKVIQPGIGIIPVPDVIAAQARIRGVVIARVIRGTPAARAGLTGVERTMRGQYRLGDVIIAVDGKKVKNFNDLYKIVDKKKIGDTVQLTIIRGDKTVEKTVKTINVSQ